MFASLKVCKIHFKRATNSMFIKNTFIIYYVTHLAYSVRAKPKAALARKLAKAARKI